MAGKIVGLGAMKNKENVVGVAPTDTAAELVIGNKETDVMAHLEDQIITNVY